MRRSDLFCVQLRAGLNQHHVVIAINLIMFLLRFVSPPPDIDECGLNTHDCPADVDCLNTDGGYECGCEGGYVPGVTNGCVGKKCLAKYGFGDG